MDADASENRLRGILLRAQVVLIGHENGVQRQSGIFFQPVGDGRMAKNDAFPFQRLNQTGEGGGITELFACRVVACLVVNDNAIIRVQDFLPVQQRFIRQMVFHREMGHRGIMLQHRLEVIDAFPAEVQGGDAQRVQPFQGQQRMPVLHQRNGFFVQL